MHHHHNRPALRITNCALCERQIDFESGFFFEATPRRIVHPDCMMYTLHRGKVSAGSTMVHTCGDPSCVNPDHLVLVPAVR